MLTEEEKDDEEGALSSGVRSALCAPVFVRGESPGCFYVDHRNVSGLFGEDEKRLAEFIATIAGAALENAEGFAKLQRLNETLEQRVADRTAAAEARAIELAVSNAELERATELRPCGQEAEANTLSVDSRACIAWQVQMFSRVGCHPSAKIGSMVLPKYDTFHAVFTCVVPQSTPLSAMVCNA